MLFEKPAPLHDNVKQTDFEELDINSKPSVENSEILQLGNLSIETFKVVDL